MSVVRYLHIVSADLLLNSYTDCILIYHSYYSWTVQRIALKFSEQWLVLHFLFCFRGTAAKQLNWLNSKFILTTTSQTFNGFSWNFQGILLKMLIVPYLFSDCAFFQSLNFRCQDHQCLPRLIAAMFLQIWHILKLVIFIF